MKIQSGLNTFHLRLVGYQFPHVTRERYDSNWLIAEGSVKHAGGAWTFRDPCLLTWEAAELAVWLQTLESQRAEAEISFIEPNISFTWLSGGKLRISFALEAAPPRSQIQEVNDDFSLLFTIDAQSLQKAGQELSSQLSNYPER
jgi:hypothetical protein